MSLFHAYKEVFGASPRALVMLSRSIGMRDVEAFVEARFGQSDSVDHGDSAVSGIRPLISHHNFNPHSLFTNYAPTSISDRALSLLIGYDGLVLSDPTVEVSTLLRAGHRTESLTRFLEITEGLSELEPLVDADVLEFTPYRPATSEGIRREVLASFGIDPDMTIFANFEQAATDARRFESAGARSYSRQASEVFALFGIDHRDFDDVEDARREMNKLAQALLHLSWSVSVCSADPGADLALHGGFEQSLFETLVEQDLEVLTPVIAGQERTRHFERLAAGSLPSMDTLELTVADALALRNDDVFGTYRDGLQLALSAYDATLLPDSNAQTAERARSDFQRQMRLLSAQLKSGAKKASFSGLVRDSSIASGIAAVTMLAPAMKIPLAAGSVILSWLIGRQRPPGKDVAVRYAAILGTEPLRSRGPR